MDQPGQTEGRRAEPSERVRIIGAEEASKRNRPGNRPRWDWRETSEDAGEAPVVASTGEGEDAGAEPQSPPSPPERVDTPAPEGDDTQLQHWADPPTGQVPRFLADSAPGGEAGQEGWTGGSGPSWREDEIDWVDDELDHATLADEPKEIPADPPPPPAHQIISSSTTATQERLSRTAEPPPASETEPGWGPTGPGAEPEALPLGSAARRARRIEASRGHSADSNVSDGAKRIAIGILLAGVTIAAFAAGTIASLVLVTLAVLAATAEAYAALRRAGHHPATLVGIVGAGGIVVACYFRGPQAIAVVWVLVVVTSLLWYMVGAARSRPASSVSSTLLGFAWVGFLGSFAGLLLDPKAFPDRHGIAYLVGAVAVTVGYDVGAYGVGSAIGRHPLAPSISPKKTVEGLIGGVIVAAAVAIAVVSHIHPWTMHRAIGLAVIGVVIAPLGDLAESMLKRDLGVKDMSSVLPGHGGILDRIDSILFVLPAVYYLLQYLHAN